MKMEEEEERENQNLFMKIFSYLYIHYPYMHCSVDQAQRLSCDWCSRLLVGFSHFPKHKTFFKKPNIFLETYIKENLFTP